MKRNLRDWIQVAADERGRIVDRDLENFIFHVASEWGERRVKVDRAVQAGTYKDEDFDLSAGAAPECEHDWKGLLSPHGGLLAVCATCGERRYIPS